MLFHPLLTAAASLLGLGLGTGLLLWGTRLHGPHGIAAATPRRALVEAMAANVVLLVTYFTGIRFVETMAGHLGLVPVSFLLTFAPGTVFALRSPAADVREFLRDGCIFLLALVSLDILAVSLGQGFSWQDLVFACGIAVSSGCVALYLRLIAELVSLADSDVGSAFEPAVPAVGAIRCQPWLVVGTAAVLLLWLAVVNLAERDPSQLYVPETLRNVASVMGLDLYQAQNLFPWLLLAVGPVIVILLVGLVVGWRSRTTAGSVFSFLCLLTGIYALEAFPSSMGPFLAAVRHLAFFSLPPVILHLALIFPDSRERLSSDQRRRLPFLLTCLYSAHLLPTLPVLLYLQTITSVELLPRVEGYLLPYLLPGLVLGLLELPLAWVVGAGLLVLAYRKRRTHRDRTAVDKRGCVWVRWLTGGGTEDKERYLRGQLAAASLGMVIVALSVSAWLALSGFGIRAGIGEWVQLVGKYVLLAFFVSIALAIVGRGRRLWASFLVMKAIAWAFLLFALRGFISWLASVVTGVATVIFGFIAIALFTWATDTRLLERFLYGLLWQRKRVWHQRLREVIETLREPDSAVDVAEAVRRACPEKVLAAWLLRPSSAPPGAEPELVEIEEIRHRGGCAKECRGRLVEVLAGEVPQEPAGVEIKSFYPAPELLTLCRTATMRSSVLVTQKALEEVLRWPHWLRERLAGHAPPGTSVHLLMRLARAGIEVVLPLGARGHLSGCVLLGTDGEGNHYDAEDIGELRSLASHLGVVMARASDRRALATTA